jgi:hypothetical protein
LSDFRGLIGPSFTPENCQEYFAAVNRYYGNRVTEIMARLRQLLAELAKANAEAHKHDGETRKELFFQRNQASRCVEMRTTNGRRRTEGAG